MCKDLKSFFNPFCLLFKKMFYRSNLNKVIFIFTFGLISRTFINNIYNVNVFSDYMNNIFVIYYSFFSLFIMIAPEFISYFHINNISSFPFINIILNSVVNFLGFVVRILISMNIRIFHYKLEDIKISSTSYVKKFFKYLGYFYNRNKAITYYNQTNTSWDNDNKTRTLYNESEEFSNSLRNYDSDATISDTESNRLAETNRINKLKSEEADKLRREESNRRRRDYMRRYNAERNRMMRELRLLEQERATGRLESEEYEKLRREELNRQSVRRSYNQIRTNRSRLQSRNSNWDNAFSNISSSYNPNDLPSISQTIIDPSNNLVRPLPYSNNTLPSLTNTKPVYPDNPVVIVEPRTGWLVNHPPVNYNPNNNIDPNPNNSNGNQNNPYGDNNDTNNNNNQGNR